MTVVFMDIALLAGMAAGLIYALDGALWGALYWGARLLPDDMVGPEGWFIDTTDQGGVYDRRR